MSSFKHSLAAVVLATTLIAGGSVSAQPAQVTASAPTNPAEIGQMLAAKTFVHGNVLIAVCDAQSPACTEFFQAFKLNAALVKGGWTAGVQNMRTSDFYTLEVASGTSTDLSKICAASGQSNLQQASCQALLAAVSASKQTPQLIMINRKTGVVEVVHGFTDQFTQSRAIVNFIKK